MASEAEFPDDAVRAAVAVEIVALTVRAGRLWALLADRAEPGRGRLALPGGFVRAGEDLGQAARRELAQAAGAAEPGHLEQLRTYGPLRRRQGCPVVSVAYLLLSPAAGGEAAGAAWVDASQIGELALGHGRILADGLERARGKLEYSALALAFIPAEFTMAQLRGVYQAVWGIELDPRNFSRKVASSGIVEPAGRTPPGQPGRPARLYRAAGGLDPASTALNPPIMRPPPAA
ncbi:MAG: NUDIX domain-containing protein [Bifidobacteriaceae bacterium]|nr:NUDIX domain-containing protein [Bifidobacteriaceae bacterium]